MTLPNFLIIGAARAGTGDIYRALKQHPDIYLSPVSSINPGAEPRFFAFEGEKLGYRGPGDGEYYNPMCITNLADYQALFQGVSHETAIGEKSPIYITHSAKSSERIRRYVPGAKIIAILRHPADRAYSEYLRLVREGRERLSFAQALAAETERRQAHWSPPWLYTQRGFYAAQLKDYFEKFERQQIRIYLYEEWTDRPQQFLGDLFGFIGVDRSFTPELNIQRSEANVPGNQLRDNLLFRPNFIKKYLRLFLPAQLREKLFNAWRKRLMITPPPLNADIRQQLTTLYRDDIFELQSLIGRDLTHWLEG